MCCRCANALICSDGELCALSYSGGVQLKTRAKYGHVLANIYFYGEDIDTLRDHIISHLRNLVATVCRQDLSSSTTDCCRNTSLYVHFPSTLSAADVDAVVRAASLQGQQPNGTGLKSTVLKRTSEVYMALESAR